jgi:cytochrome c oxidase subunit I
VFIGFNLTFIPQFLMGALGMPRRYATYAEEFHIYHILSTVGSWVIAMGFFVHLFSLIASLYAGKKAPPNPWGGLTLEWTDAGSPPIEHNFHHEPVVTHGPYDFDTVLPPQTKPGEFILPVPKPGKGHH